MGCVPYTPKSTFSYDMGGNGVVNLNEVMAVIPGNRGRSLVMFLPREDATPEVQKWYMGEATQRGLLKKLLSFDNEPFIRGPNGSIWRRKGAQFIRLVKDGRLSYCYTSPIMTKGEVDPTQIVSINEQEQSVELIDVHEQLLH